MPTEPMTKYDAILRDLSNRRRNSDIRADDRELRDLVNAALTAAEQQLAGIAACLRRVGHHPESTEWGEGFEDRKNDLVIGVECLIALKEAAKQKAKDAETALARYKWRPIAEIHEDHGACIVMNLADPANLGITEVCDVEFNADDWTHFVEVPKLSHEEAQVLWTAMKGTSE